MWCGPAARHAPRPRLDSAPLSQSGKCSARWAAGEGSIRHGPLLRSSAAAAAGHALRLLAACSSMQRAQLGCIMLLLLLLQLLRA